MIVIKNIEKDKIEKRGNEKVLKNCIEEFCPPNSQDKWNRKSCFLKQSMKLHPDKGGNEDDFKRLTNCNDKFVNQKEKISNNPKNTTVSSMVTDTSEKEFFGSLTGKMLTDETEQNIVIKNIEKDKIEKRGNEKILKNCIEEFCPSNSQDEWNRKSCFLKQSMKLHPDKGGNEDDFKRLTNCNDKFVNQKEKISNKPKNTDVSSMVTDTSEKEFFGSLTGKMLTDEPEQKNKKSKLSQVKCEDFGINNTGFLGKTSKRNRSKKLKENIKEEKIFVRNKVLDVN